MKEFEIPEIKVIQFVVEDIITESNELPLAPLSVEDDLGIVTID